MKEHIDYFKKQIKGCDFFIEVATAMDNKKLLQEQITKKEHLEFAIMCMEYFVVGGTE